MMDARTGADFPVDDYTPHGYLANPYAVAHSWSEGEGGCLRTTREHVGMGWQLPWALQAQASVDLIVTLESGGRRLATRTDFDAAGLNSPHHSSRLFVYRWEAFGRVWEATYVLLERDVLGLVIVWSPIPVVDSTALPEVRLATRMVGTRRAGEVRQVDDSVELGETFGRWEVRHDAADVGSTASGTSFALMRRAKETLSQDPANIDVQDLVWEAVRRAREADTSFWSGAARLEGDWPDAWRRGWVYDTETTRMCVYPPGGIFTDIWPAWMVQWPRAVIAENTLDMARFAYASPDLAGRALLSLFRDAEAPNVPCVFQHGEPNMVAKDGSVCGTSPAWCVPFYNLERLFSFTLDREWLAAIYPYLKAYLEWWRAERTDAEGWAVYKCTWEAGEDDTPRLDPERRGDNVVSAFVRPVELQATMALSAGVMKRFSAVLGEDADTTRWSEQEAEYLGRTRQLWDADAGRFRDWDARNNRFLAPAPDQPNYWGIDPCRFSALAFTPLLAGLVDDEYRRGLRAELQQYDGPPWTLWASWSYVVLEAARFAGGDVRDEHATGRPGFAARVAAGIVGRVYGELDARQIADPRHPTPGVAREYWPLDLDTWASCEGYGWGANTASLLVRQVFGFIEGPYVDEAGAPAGMASVGDAAQPDERAPAAGPRAASLTFELRPGLPDDLLIPGREYWLTNLPYRGARLSVGYRIVDGRPDEPATFGALSILVSAGVPTRCRAENRTASKVWDADADVRHEIPGLNGAVYSIHLEIAG